MTLYLEATTTIPDLFIDYIEVRLASGESASLNWDESEIYRNPDGFGAKYKGVYFGEEPANGRLDELCDMVITDIGLMELLFLADLSEAETAKRLNCSLQYVRNQRCIALKKLRSRLMEGGDDE